MVVHICKGGHSKTTMDQQVFEAAPSSKRHWYKVNRLLLPTKAFYFFFYAASGCLLPFLPVYKKHLGLTPDETGIIYGVMPFLTFSICLVVNGLADKFQKHRFVLIGFTLLTGVLYLLIKFVPVRTIPSSVTVQPIYLHCHSTGSVVSACSGSVKEENKDSGLMQDDSTSKCFVSLEEFSKGIADDVAPKLEANGTNRTFFHDVIQNNRTQSMFSFNQSSKSYSHGACAVTCYSTHENISALRNGSQTSTGGVCFTNKEETSHQSCTGIHDQFQRLTMNLTNLLQMFNLENNGEPNSTLHGQGCQYTYPLLDVEYYGQTYSVIMCPVPKTLTCRMQCTGVPVSLICATEAVRLDVTFSLLFATTFLATSAFLPVFSMVDAVTFDQLGSEHNKFGQQRMWGTMGLAIFAVITTFAVSPGNDPDGYVNYDLMFYLFAGFCVLSTIIASTVRIPSRLQCQKMMKNACHLLSLPEVLAFMGVVTHMGMISGSIQGFLFWYLADLGAVPLLFGLCLAVNCSSEIIFFFYSGPVFQRFSPIKCIYVSVLVMIVRLVSYSVLTYPWYVLFAEALHGVTFGLFWAAVVNHANAICPPGMSSTVQGLVGSLYFGIGKGIGSVVTGVLFSGIGERWTFRTLAITCLVILTIYVFFNTYVFTEGARQQTDKEQKTEKEKEEELCQQEKFLQSEETDTNTV